MKRCREGFHVVDMVIQKQGIDIVSFVISAFKTRVRCKNLRVSLLHRSCYLSRSSHVS